jgi:ElaB/YqjD/DUF883 family membrane-anchored ribosome-binding protein
MNYNNHYEDDSSPVSREEFGELIETLEKLMADESPNIQVALQPTVTALKQLAAHQIASRKEAIEDREKVSQQLKAMSEKIDKIVHQSSEIAAIRHQNQKLSDWLPEYLDWKKIAGCAILVTVISVAASAVIQKIALSNLETTITDQQGVLYKKVIEMNKKAKK